MGWTNVVVFVGRIASPLSKLEGKEGCKFIVYNPKYLPKMEVGEVVRVPEAVKICCAAFKETALNLRKFVEKGDVISIVGSIESIKLLDKPTQKYYTTLMIRVNEFTLISKHKKNKGEKK